MSKPSRPALIDAYFAYQRTHDEALAWAWDLVDGLGRSDHEEAWPMFLDLIAAAPDPFSLGLLAAGGFEDMLKESGPNLIDRMEAEAPVNPRLREAIAGVWLSHEDMDQKFVDRIYDLAERGAAQWPVAASSLHEAAERLLTSPDPADRVWGVNQIDTDLHPEAAIPRLRLLLGDPMRAVRIAAASQLALVGDVDSADEVIDLVARETGAADDHFHEHPAELAGAALRLAQQAGVGAESRARQAITALADRADSGVAARLRSVLDPAPIVDDPADLLGEFLDTIPEDVKSEIDTPGLRRFLNRRRPPEQS